MADLINLNKARKAKQRAEAERKAAENRVIFGRTKAQRQADSAAAAAAARRLDALRRESPPDAASADDEPQDLRS